MRVLLFALFTIAASACRHRPTVIQVPVSYLAPAAAARPPRTVPAQRVFVSVENRFGDTREIGRDANAKVPIEADPAAVVRWVDAGFRGELARVGAKVATSSSEADVVLKVGLSVVNVEEGGTYTARLVAQLEVTDRGGTTLATSTLQGSGSHQGRDYDGDEVNTTLNIALADLIARFFGDQSLMSKL